MLADLSLLYLCSLSSLPIRTVQTSENSSDFSEKGIGEYFILCLCQVIQRGGTGGEPGTLEGTNFVRCPCFIQFDLGILPSSSFCGAHNSDKEPSCRERHNWRPATRTLPLITPLGPLTQDMPPTFSPSSWERSRSSVNCERREDEPLDFRLHLRTVMSTLDADV